MSDPGSVHINFDSEIYDVDLRSTARKLIDIDAENGVATVNVTVKGKPSINITYDNSTHGVAGLMLGETETTAYRGDRGKIAYDHSQVAHAPANAQKNVQSDWNENNATSDAYIRNKPTILLTETDPIFNAWLATNPLAAFLTAETEPAFTAWLAGNPLQNYPTKLQVKDFEADPVFIAWLATNPFSAFLTSETDPVFTAWLLTNPLNGFITDAPSDSRTYGRKDGSWQEVIIEDAGISNVFTEPDPQFPIERLKYTLDGINYDITDIAKPNGVITGGIVSWLSGLTFTVSPVAYYINGDLYTISGGSITLSAADALNPRIDIIIIDTLQTISIIEGIPAENPQKPTPDPETQIELTQILVPAGATEPIPEIVSGMVIYDENTEWTGSSTGVTVNFNSATSPFHGSKCADVGSIGGNDIIAFTTGSPVSAASFQNFVMNIKLKAAFSNQQSLRVQFFNGASAVSSEIILSFNKTTLNTWQNIAIPIASLSLSSGTINKVQFKFVRSGGSSADMAGFYLDFIKFETGIQQPIFNSSIKLEGDVFGTGVTGSPVNTTLSTVLSNPGTYGDSANIPQVTVDAKGRIIDIQTVTNPIPVKATGAEITTGTNDDKFVTAKSVTDSNIVQSNSIKMVVAISQVDYDALVTKEATTLYLING